MINAANTIRISSGGRLALSRLSAVSLLICALGVLAPATLVSAEPMLWGVDEDDGELFSIADYSTLSGFTSYGQLKYDKNGDLRNVGGHIEAFGLDPFGTAYMAKNRDQNGVAEPVLMTFDIADATTTGPNIATVVGTLGVTFDSDGDNITGLSFQPGTGSLYGLLRDNGSSTTDRLLIFDPSTGGLVSDLGTIDGLGRRVRNGEDMTFDRLGNLYVTDDNGDRLYRIDPATADIVEIVDDDMGHSVKYESLAWDHTAGRMIGFDDRRNTFADLTLTDGNNTPLGQVSGLTDVEGMSFVPPGVPEPATLSVLAVGGICVLVRRRRRHR